MEQTRFLFSAFADEIDADFDKQLEALGKLGIPMLELRGVNGKSFTALTDDEVKEVGEKLQKAGIRLSSLGSPIGKIDVTSDFEAHKALLTRIMDIGDMLDCKRIRMFSFYPADLDRQAFEERVFAWMEELLDMASARGFVLCHENEKDIYGCSPEEELALMQHFDGRLRVVLDPGNFAFCKLDASKGYPLLKDYIEYFHIKDADEEGIIVPPGKGVAHLEDIMKSVVEDRPGETVILTMEPHLMVFDGLSSLSKLDDIKHKYTFASPFEAFSTAYEAAKAMAVRAGAKVN